MSEPLEGSSTAAAGTSTAAAREVLGLNILVPSSWYEFDIHPAMVDKSIRDVVAARIEQRPELAEHRSALKKMLRRAAAEARDANVVYAGSMLEIIDDEPMTANLTVSVSQAEDKQTGKVAKTGLDTLLATFNPIPRGPRPTDVWRRVSVVELPDAGPAARSEGIEEIEVPNDGRSYRAVMMQTLVPYPGNNPKVAVISASTPQLALVEPMLELFGAITDTFSFVYAEPDGETPS
ncbi:hypothetical protein [Streptomyces ochraceiscleroticus]|uniref:Uncharacterized protein n=1 Tax=Streptomyces ochraceiscleroticus TaxID=47761 RepID=A0ABW1MGT9_9ACTN|nr:hypothetical protein [Streptomyces ochraceiscleroticus]